MVTQQESFSSIPSETETIGMRPPDFLSQCFRAFNNWYSLLEKHDHGKKGNLVACPGIDCDTGTIYVAETNVVEHDVSSASELPCLGFTGTKSHLIHGSVVSLYCDASKSFLQLEDGLACPNEASSCQSLPTDSTTELFLVVDLGHGCFALYNVKLGLFVGINASFEVYGLCSSANLAGGGVCDEDIVERIPDDAIFVVRSERSDDSLVSFCSLFRKRFLSIESDSIEATATRPGLHELIRIVVVMDSKCLGGLDERSNWIPASSSSRKFTIQQCFNAFFKWQAGLATLANRLDGVLVGLAKQDPATGDISVPKTEVLQHAVKLEETRLGAPGRAGSLSHCNVVALTSLKLDRLLLLDFGKICINHDKFNITHEARRCQFLVLKLGENLCAFYHVHCGSFLVVKSPDEVVAIQPKSHLERASVSDEQILSRVPDGAVFTVKREGIEGSAVSLFSNKFQRFLTFTEDGKINATGTSPGDQQLIQVVLLMKVELFAEPGMAPFAVA
jgi:hypothetical protein